MELEGDILVHIVSILENKTMFIRNRSIRNVKVQWTHYILEEATWDMEDEMREEYPHLFEYW